MTERRYTEEEVAAIFERAAKTEHTPTVPAESTGMTLAALQEIGREVGLSPASISHAARSLDQAGRPAGRTLLGLPIGVGRTVEFDGPLSEQTWELLVSDLRETFQARGRVRYDGPFRQWTNGNLQALIEPTPRGYRLRLQTVKGDSQTLIIGGMTIAAGAAATTTALAAAGSLGSSGSMAGIGLMALVGMGMFAAGALRLPGWARRRSRQMEQITARLGAATPPESLENPEPTLGS
jgi:hypothetical protein